MQYPPQHDLAALGRMVLSFAQLEYHVKMVFAVLTTTIGEPIEVQEVFRPDFKPMLNKLLRQLTSLRMPERDKAHICAVFDALEGLPELVFRRNTFVHGRLIEGPGETMVCFNYAHGRGEELTADRLDALSNEIRGCIDLLGGIPASLLSLH